MTDDTTEEAALWSALQAAPDRAVYRAGALRTVAPAVTLRRIAPMLRPAGITRLADLTGLDYAGVPVYQAVRPNSRNLSVSQGKGLTRVQAKVSALMESLVSFHAERIDQPRTVATIAALTPDLPYDPRRLLRPIAGPVPDDVALEWIRGTDLTGGRPAWVPAQVCELDAVVGDRLARLHFVASSNGLASGNTVAEAVLRSGHPPWRTRSPRYAGTAACPRCSTRRVSSPFRRTPCRPPGYST